MTHAPIPLLITILICLIMATPTAGSEVEAIQKVATGFRFTEGPAADAQGRIYFSDIPNNRIHRHDPKTGQTTVFAENTGGANGLMFTAAGKLLACQGKAKQVSIVTEEGIEPLVTNEAGPFNSPNDLVIDEAGGVIYFTDPHYGRGEAANPVEGVYVHHRKTGKTERIIDNLVRPNGITMSPDGERLYVADHAAKLIMVYPILQPGRIGEGKVFAKLDPDARGGPDGMTIDQRGQVYAAGQGAIWIWSPTGELQTKVAIPEEPTNVTFGSEKLLYVTARTSLYRVPVDTEGIIGSPTGKNDKPRP